MKEDTISRIAVVILAIILAIFGIYHLMYPGDLITFIPAFLPGGNIWIYITGISLILAAIAFIAHKQVKLAGYLLALLLIIITLTFHLPNYLNAGDSDLKTTSFIDILQNLSMAAFAMYIASNAKKI